MKTPRIIAVAVLVVASSLALHVALSQQQGIKRTDLQRHDINVPGREVVQVRVERAPGVSFPKALIRGRGQNSGDVLFIPAEKNPVK